MLSNELKQQFGEILYNIVPRKLTIALLDTDSDLAQLFIVKQIKPFVFKVYKENEDFYIDIYLQDACVNTVKVNTIFEKMQMYLLMQRFYKQPKKELTKIITQRVPIQKRADLKELLNVFFD